MPKQVKEKTKAKSKNKPSRKKMRITFFEKLPSVISWMVSKIRLFFRILILSVIAFFVGVVILINNVDPNKYKNDIQKALELALNRPIQIEGEIKWRLISFEPAVQMERVKVGNTSWGKSQYIFDAKNISVMLSFKNLVARKISVETILIDNPKLYLEISSKGVPNWDFTNLLPDKEATIENIQEKIKNDEKVFAEAIHHKKFEIAIKSVQIKNAEISYDNRKNKIKENFTIQNFLIYSKDYTQPTFIDLVATYKDKVIDGSFKTASIEDFIKRLKIIPFTGVVDLNGIGLYFVSQISDIMNFESLSANVSLKIPDLQKSLDGFANLPKFGSIVTNFELILTPKIAAVKKLKLVYDDITNLTGDIDIVLNKKPDIKANLYIPEFDIPKMFYPLWEPAYFERLKTGAKKPKSVRAIIEDPKAFRNIPLPINELDLANLNLRLKIDTLKAMPEMAINNIRLNAMLNNGNAIIAPLAIDYMGGKMFLDIIANNENDTFNGEVSIKGSDINIGDIIASTGYKDIFTGGNTNIDIVLKGIGPNLAEFMKNLNGYVKVYTTTDLIGYRIENLVMANDVISSIFKFVGEDIIGGIAGKNKKAEKSTIECAIVNLNVQDGKSISNRGIAIQTKSANIVIDGMANLGDEYVDVSIVTIVKEGLGVSNSLAEMIRIRGSMAKPSVIISKDGVIKNIVKTSFATVLAGIFTGGATLITAGVGLLTKSWLENISADKNPCLTAFEGKVDNKKSGSEDFGNQVILRENLTSKIKEERKRLNEETSSTIDNTKKEVKKKVSK